MRALGLVLLFCAAARGADIPALADAAVAAHRAGSDAALARVAASSLAWHVVEELLQRGEHDVAGAYAAARAAPDAAALREYVAAAKARPPDPAYPEAWGVWKLYAADRAAALAKLESLRPFPRTVTAYRVGIGRGYMLRQAGRVEESIGAYDACAELAFSLEWTDGATAALAEAGKTALASGRYAAAIERWQRCLEFAGDNERERMRMRTNLALACRALGRVDEALEHLRAAAKTAEELGAARDLATVLLNLGATLLLDERLEEAEACHRRGVDVAAAAGDEANVTQHLCALALVLRERGDYATAEAVLERVRPRAAGDGPLTARILAWLADCRYRRGDLEGARGLYVDALALQEKGGASGDYAQALTSLAQIMWRYGEYGKAIVAAERGAELAAEAGARLMQAQALHTLGDIHHNLGDAGRALEALRRAVELARSMEHAVTLAGTLVDMGNSVRGLDRYAEAEAALLEACSIYERLGRAHVLAGALHDLGRVYEATGRTSEAEAHYRRALAANRQNAAHRWEAVCLQSLARLAEDRDEVDRLLAEALDAAVRSGAPFTIAAVHWARATARYGRGAYAAAVQESKAALDRVPLLQAGLAEEEGARARRNWAFLFRLGASAAYRAGDLASLCLLLERGRAGTLAESLVGRDELRRVRVPADLRAAEQEAGRAALLAAEDLRGAEARGERAAIRSARERLEKAQAARQDAAARLERAAKARSPLLEVEAATLEQIREGLRDGEALVTYGVMPGEAVALVVTREKARAVGLGPGADLDGAGPEELARLAVAPLELPDSVRRVLVSPDGVLCYAPFAQLFPDRDVACVPSGTVLRMLRASAAARGGKVLAIGDPAYAEGGRFARIPASRGEAGSLGDRTLLGAEATEAGLLAALRERPRWRAVHFACHGVVDAERPLLSSLALAPEAGSDGMLTVLEVLRLDVPADLVVLSACETARGRIYEAEGVVGFVRAFLLAGTPRVIVSLWKVDDAATRALMTKFYELWNPGDGATGLDAAAALRGAQAFVAGQERWQDPRFWAAWQLWGLPD